jgi:hypothetical protein
MIKKYFSFLILPFIFSFSYSCFAQQEKAFDTIRDSVYRYQGIIPPLEFKYNFEEIFSKSLLSEVPDDILFDNNPSTIWLRTEILLSKNFTQTDYGEMNTFFTAPLYQQYLRDSEFDMVRYILGTVQTGAVAYMAYRHIKKYGFWK